MDKVTLYIPEDLIRKAKAKAALEGTSLSAIVREYLKFWSRDIDSLEELAKAAEEKAGPIDFEEIISDAINAYGNITRFGDRFYTFDYDSIFQRYAEELGRPELTTREKQQAILNAVLEQCDEQD